MIFEDEEDRFVVITVMNLIPDVWLGKDEEVVDGDGVLCMLLGTSEITWWEGAVICKNTAFCLVLKHSDRQEGAFERVGVIICDPESRIFGQKENRLVELI